MNCEMTNPIEEVFVQRVFLFLNAPVELDEELKKKLTSEAKRKFSKGWNVGEVVRLFNCIEDVNPDLEEDVALRRMAKINAEVKERLAREEPK